mgnify:CR=1 FL=1
MPHFNSMEALLNASKQCHNYNKYDPIDWVYIARLLVHYYGLSGAYAVLDSKHMRWCEDQTFEGFVAYLDENINRSEVDSLLVG